MLRSLICILLSAMLVCCTCHASSDNFLQDYQNVIMHEEDIGDSFFYPDFFRDHDRIIYRNIVAEIRFRLEFIAGLKPQMPYSSCFNYQDKISRAIEALRKNNTGISFKRLDDNLLRNEQSPFYDMAKTNVRSLSPHCSFNSIGDLEAGGSVYCVYHGPSHNSPFFRRNIERFNAASPFLTAFDVVEFLIFLPALIAFPIIWLIMRKFLEKKTGS